MSHRCLILDGLNKIIKDNAELKLILPFFIFLIPQLNKFLIKKRFNYHVVSITFGIRVKIKQSPVCLRNSKLKGNTETGVYFVIVNSFRRNLELKDNIGATRHGHSFQNSSTLLQYSPINCVGCSSSSGRLR